MSLKLVYNTTDSAVLADEAGYTIGGRGWGSADTADPIAKAELAAGRLVLVDEDSLAASGNDDALAAVAAFHARRDALEAARALPKVELVEALDDDVVDALPKGGDGLPAKDDLVEAVAASGEDGKKKSATTPRRGQK